MRTLQIILVSIFLSALPQIKAIQAQTIQEQVIENRIEQRQNTKEIEELSSTIKEIDNKIEKKVDDRIDVMKGNLESRDHAIDWWLGIIGIVLTILGLGLPLFAWKLRGDFKEKQKEFDETFKEQKSTNQKNTEKFEHDVNNYRNQIQNIKESAEKEITEMIKQANEKLEKIKKDELKSSEHLTVIEGNKTKSDEMISQQGKNIGFKMPSEEDNQNFETNEIELLFENHKKDFEIIIDLLKSRDFNAVIEKCKEKLENKNLPKEVLIDIYRVLVDAYKGMSDFDNQLEYLKKILEIEKDEITWLKLGNLFLEHNYLKNSEDAFREVLSINPNSYMAMFNLGDLLIKSKRAKESIEILTKAITIAPNERKIRLQLAYAYYTLNEYTKSIEIYEDILKLEPSIDDIRFFNNLSSLYLQVGLPIEALKNVEKCLLINANDNLAIYHKSRVLNEMEKYEDALDNYIKAFTISNNENNVPILKSCCVNIIELATLINKKETALRYFDELYSRFSMEIENDYQFNITKTLYKIIFDEDYKDSWNLAVLNLENQNKNGETHENHWSFELAKKALNLPVTDFIPTAKKLVLLEFIKIIEKIELKE